MKTFVSAFILTVLIFSPYFAGADTGQLLSNVNPPIPDFNGWKVVSLSRIELRISDCAVVYLGVEVEYNNPNDPREFIRVSSRHIPVPISKCKKYNERLLSQTVVTDYNQKEEDDLLGQRSKEIDHFLFLHWRTKKDSRNGRNVLDGDVDIWFMLANGHWLFHKNEEIAVEFLTENIGNGKTRNIFSGMESRIGDAYHLLRVSRNDILRLLEGEPTSQSSSEGGK